ncbi:MAG: hypothetical protein WD063_14915 [Pirellulales bacterium]
MPLEDADWFPAIQLEEGDVRQYRVDLDSFAKHLRHENGIEGEELDAEGEIIALGRRIVDGFGAIDVYLSLSNVDPSEFSGRCRTLERPQGTKRIVVLTPLTVVVRNSHRQLLESKGITIVALSGDNMKVDWLSVVATLASTALPDGYHAPNQVVFRGIEHTCSLSRKEELFIAKGVVSQFVQIDQVMRIDSDAVWRETFRNTKAQRDRISQFLGRLNNKLAKATPPLRLSFHVVHGKPHIRRHDFSNASQSG